MKKKTNTKTRVAEHKHSFDIWWCTYIYSDVIIPVSLQNHTIKEFNMWQMLKEGKHRWGAKSTGWIWNRILKTWWSHDSKSTIYNNSALAQDRHTWSRSHIDFTGPLNGGYYLIIVISYMKCLEIFKCSKPTSKIITAFLEEKCLHYVESQTLYHPVMEFSTP